MKLILTDKNGRQYTSMKFNGGEVKKGTTLEDFAGDRYKVKKIIEIFDHHVIIHVKELKK